MSDEEINQALMNIHNKLKGSIIYKNPNLNSWNVGIATIEGIGKVVYAKMVEVCGENKTILFNDGIEKVSGIFHPEKTFKLAGIYRDKYSGTTYTIKKIEPISNIGKRLNVIRMTMD